MENVIYTKEDLVQFLRIYFDVPVKVTRKASVEELVEFITSHNWWGVFCQELNTLKKYRQLEKMCGMR